ncbi:MAG: right-handed parallel beta-helix repeat-containing protein [Verrucomicrobiales bacterium]|nr:right-handed parallel beta-helix repeat-containing protein [Verrucomicrobiales bacterium]
MSPVTGDLYVTVQGNDAHDGRTRETALATLQRAVEVLRPGQTLVIGPGDYFGPVAADHLGSPDVETVIQAEIPGTVLLRGDIPAPSFRPLAGFRRVHVADLAFDQDIQVMNEVDTLRVLPRAPNLSELEYSPGHFYQDRAARKLYVSSSDTRPADRHVYTLTVVGTHGLYLDTPVRVRVEGLTVTGFNSAAEQPYAQQTLWATYGIFIKNGKRSVIAHCQTYLNGRGIGSSNEGDRAAGDNRIEDCQAWGNGGVGLGYDTGGIDLLYARRDQVRNSVAFLNQGNGISMRGGVPDHHEADASVAGECLSWGNLHYDFWIKAGPNFNFFENSVASGSTGITEHLRRSVIGSGTVQGNDSIVLGQEPDIDLQREFADPDHYDFRLQADSRFIGAADGGGDRGAFAYREDVFYLSVNGSDAADGLSVARAFGTPGRSFARLSPGDTLYLTPGVHSGDLLITLQGNPADPIVIRGRGREPVVFGGKVRITDSRAVRFENLHFAQDVTLENSDAIHFTNVVFRGQGTALSASDSMDLRVTQSSFTEFTEAAIRLPCTTGVHLAGNVYNNRSGPALQVFSAQAIRYSDYNSYARLEGAWQLGAGAGSLAEVRANHDRKSAEIVPEFVAHGDSVTLSNAVAFLGGVVAGNPLGAFRRDVPREELRLLEPPSVHSVSATTANIEWFTSHPAVTSLSWGPTPALANHTTLDVNRFGSFSLAGLTTGTTYYFRIDALRIPDAVPILAEPVQVAGEVLQFTTKAADEAPRTYFVSPNGSDDHLGLTPDSPFRTIQKAANEVNVGDTVVVGGGTYPETVRLRATGSPTAPISFLGRPGERVTLDGAGGLLDFAFVVGKKSHLRFDNFVFSNHGATVSDSGAWEPSMGGQFNLYGCQDIQISRVLSDGRTTSDRLVVAKDVDGLRLSNSVDGNKLEGLYLENCPNLLIERSVFARPMITGFILRNYGAETALIRNCIFTDSLAVKSFRDALGNPNNIGLLTIDGEMDDVVLRDNLFFLRYFSPGKRHLVGDLGYDSLRDIVLFGTRFADPVFQGVVDLLAEGGTLDPYDPSLPPFPPDSLWSMNRPFNFRTWFATDPAVVGAGIGLDPTQFDAVTGLPR